MTERCSYILFIIIIGGILVLFICITRLTSNEIFSPSNKILVHREVGRVKDLSAPLYREEVRKVLSEVTWSEGILKCRKIKNIQGGV